METLSTLQPFTDMLPLASTEMPATFWVSGEFRHSWIHICGELRTVFKSMAAI